MRYTYSRWSNAQNDSTFDPDEIMEALSDDLLADGDLRTALQRVMRWGLQGDGHERMPGLQNVLQQLRAQRQQELARYNLDSAMQGIANQVQEIVDAERNQVRRRLDESDKLEDEELAQLLRAIAERKQAFLDELPEDPAAAITSLADYEFLDELAREKFSALMDLLQQQVLESHFRSTAESLQKMRGAQLDGFKSMLRDLNRLLKEGANGGPESFSRFMEQHGQYFQGAESLPGLMEDMLQQAAYMESLMRSMAPEMRSSLEGMLQAVMRDEELRNQLEEVAETLRSVAAFAEPGRPFPFTGDDSLTLDEALRLMRRMHDLDQLERDLKEAQDTNNIESLNAPRIRELMGDEAHQAIDRLQRLTRVLEEAGYMEQSGGSYQLTARGVRKIGLKALQDIFHHLKLDALGRHAVPFHGSGGDRTDDRKTYEFGDAFLLDMSQTLMNSVMREGAGSPLQLQVRDFEVFRTEYMTRSSTVLMLDMSRSMPLRGCFVAAKKVAFALNSLIRTQYPRDDLYIIGFSDYARELRPESLHQISWGDYVYGTNMQHGFILARRLLARRKAANKQIILITDGEPTAHFEGDRVHFSYPPTFRTFSETLREVKRCTQEGIVINTFMLERSHYLADFVNQMTRINRGRAFFATPIVSATISLSTMWLRRRRAALKRRPAQWLAKPLTIGSWGLPRASAPCYLLYRN